MDKYIGLDMDCKKTVGYAIVPGQSESSATFGPDVGSIRRYLRQHSVGGYRVHAVFEISGQAGFLYDELVSDVASLHIANPSKMTRILGPQIPQIFTDYSHQEHRDHRGGNQLGRPEFTDRFRF